MFHPRSGGIDDWIFSSLRSSPNIEQWREIIFLINFIDIKRYTCVSYNIFKFKRVEANIYIIIKNTSTNNNIGYFFCNFISKYQTMEGNFTSDQFHQSKMIRICVDGNNCIYKEIIS